MGNPRPRIESPFSAEVQVLLLQLLTGLFYLDQARPAAVIAASFLTANGLGAYFSIAGDDRMTYGVGYARPVEKAPLRRYPEGSSTLYT